LFLLSELVICFIAGLWFSRLMWRNHLFEGLEDDLSLIFVSGFIAYCIALAINAKPFATRLAAVVAMDLYFYIMADSISPITVFALAFISATIVTLPYFFAKHKRQQERVASQAAPPENKDKTP
jgi:hypothetical protein